MTDLQVYSQLESNTTLFTSPDPAAIVAQATRIANEIAPLIRDQHLVKRIGQSEHVFLEGWTLAGSMLGVFPITVASGPIYVEGEYLGYEATVEARTMAGHVVGRADAQCTVDENEKWRLAPSFQQRSMAQTRAASKALRMPLGFVMRLAGYDVTPAEEMEAAAARGETVSSGKGVRPGWRDLAEQQREHAKVGELIDAHGLRSWVAEWLESKAYERPLAKGQLNQLRRAIETEITERSEAGEHAPPAGEPAPAEQSGGEATSAAAPPDPDASAAGERDTGLATGRPSAVEAQTGEAEAVSGEEAAAASTDRSRRGRRGGSEQPTLGDEEPDPGRHTR